MVKFQVIEGAGLPRRGGSYSIGVAWRELVVTAGQVGGDPKTGMQPAEFADEVALALQNLVRVLAAASCGTDDVLKTTCFLSDMSRFAEFDHIYRSVFREPYPARSTVGATLAGGFRFEIEAIAARD